MWKLGKKGNIEFLYTRAVYKSLLLYIFKADPLSSRRGDSVPCGRIHVKAELRREGGSMEGDPGDATASRNYPHIILKSIPLSEYF